MKEVKTIKFTKRLTYKYLVILACALSCMMTSMPTILATVDTYNPKFITIQVKDGEYPVREEKVEKGNVEEVLNQLNLGLGSYDEVNMRLDTSIKEGDYLEITRIHYIETSVLETIEPGIDYVYKGSRVNTTTHVSDGIPGMKKITFQVKYVNGKEVESKVLNEVYVQEPVDEVIAKNSIQEGAFFTGRLTTYGLDCYGCSGTTAAGVNLASLGKATYTYKGKEYYVLAADRSIPMYSIIKITNHKLGLPETIYGIVLDRGGAIYGNKIDIYCGREFGNRFFSGGTSYKTEFEIISVGR